jgi:hypothetical protein
MVSEAVIGSLLVSIVPSDVVWGAHYSMHVIGIKRLAAMVRAPLLTSAAQPSGCGAPVEIADRLV